MEVQRVLEVVNADANLLVVAAESEAETYRISGFEGNAVTSEATQKLPNVWLVGGHRRSHVAGESCKPVLAPGGAGFNEAWVLTGVLAPPKERILTKGGTCSLR